MTQNLDAVISWITYTEGLAAVQVWKIDDDISTIPVYKTIKW